MNLNEENPGKHRLKFSSAQDLEEECLKPEPSKFLSDIGLALLKFVSSHRGLT